MKIKLPGVNRISIISEFIRLDSLLKLSSIVSTGGEAKILIQNGEVRVDGEPCTMRGKKIHPGDVVQCGGSTLIVKQTI